MSGALVGLMVLCCIARSPELSELTRQFGQAEKQYDLAQARTLVEVQRSTVDRSTPLPHLQVYAASLLLRAHLAELGSEQIPESDSAEREALRREAFESAQESLARLGGMPETPEIVRMRADCYAVLAKCAPLTDTQQAEWTAAVTRALDIGGSNPRVHVAAARLALYQEKPEEALEHVERALVLNPVLESAMLLRAKSHELAGRPDEARAAWQRLLTHNPAASYASFRLNQQAALARVGAAQPG